MVAPQSSQGPDEGRSVTCTSYDPTQLLHSILWSIPFSGHDTK
ncbi:TPA: hypothetical protein ACKRGW_001600 [Proteus mirabilis]|nr:hypothetical protein [Proteus terrae]